VPNRIIKESICTSEQIDSLSQSAEILFYRLMVNCDDYGLFDARLKLVASKCYPLKSIEINSLRDDLASLQAANLVFLYEVDGKTYGKLTSWEKHQQVRAKRAKFPLPENGSEIICNQLIANVPGIQSNPIQSESNPNPIQEEPPRAKRTPPIEKPSDVDEQVWQDWIQLRKEKRATVTKTVIDGAVIEAAKAGMSLNDFLTTWCRRGSQGLEAGWLKPVERVEPKKQAETFRERDDRTARERWEQMTGETHPGNLRQPGVNAPAKRLEITQ